ncbi:hypothetical protein [Kitasatospora sp. NPDC092286]|uniref:hypothetical protein n=1 Tax=Kitasatospora sp. NPDC092286 TaxID=3364087 RepID=UPI00380D6A2F
MNTGERPTWMLRSLSEPRLEPHAPATGAGEEAARLHRWNIEVSAAFYGAALPGGHAPQRPARRKCERRIRHRQVTADDVVAELSFGFWVKLLSGRHARTFWVPALHRAFPSDIGRRDDLHRRFVTMMRLRNRISHHEPIHHRHLEAGHATLHHLLACLDAEPAAQALRLDRVPAVLKQRQDTCPGLRPPRF